MTLKIAGELQMKALSHDMGLLRRENERLKAQNAKLVKALRTAIAVEQSHGQDSQPWAEEARALLHKLGEG